MRTLLERLRLVCVVVSPWRALALDANDAVVEIDVRPCEGNGFRDARAGADEQLGQHPVVVCAGVEVRTDLVEPQVVVLATIKRQRTDSQARVACHQAVFGRVGQSAGQRGSFRVAAQPERPRPLTMRSNEYQAAFHGVPEPRLDHAAAGHARANRLQRPLGAGRNYRDLRVRPNVFSHTRVATAAVVAGTTAITARKGAIAMRVPVPKMAGGPPRRHSGLEYDLRKTLRCCDVAGLDKRHRVARSLVLRSTSATTSCRPVERRRWRGRHAALSPLRREA
jgi:hypothetical protein